MISSSSQLIEVEKILAGNRGELARAITLAESSLPKHRVVAENLLQRCLPHSGKSLRIGLTGAPGVGKSTLIEALGCYAITQGKKVAVLAVDPSSQTSGGSILGDKTRMFNLSASEQAFIRPSPAGEVMGGVARRTQESIILCEAAGFDIVIIETVGVGQSETMVADLTDLFILMLLPGGGDELQGIKRGIMELADIILVNKADGEFEAKANLSLAETKQALRFIPQRRDYWQTQTMTVSALQQKNIARCWDLINDFNQKKVDAGMLQEERLTQAEKNLWSEAKSLMLDLLVNDDQAKVEYEKLRQQVARKQILPSMAATKLVQHFIKK